MGSDAVRGATRDRPHIPVHVPVVVVGNELRAARSSRRFVTGDARSMLRAYLELIRRLRDQRRAPTIELRSADIEVLATHLGVPGAEVVEHLASLMGASRSQRTSMLTLFGAGALVIGLAGSTAAGRGTPPSSVPHLRAAPIALTTDAPVAPAPRAGATVTTTTTPAATDPTDAEDVLVAVEAPAPTTTLEPPVIEDPPNRDTDDGPRPQPPAATTADAPTPDTTEPVITDIGDPPLPPATTEPVVVDIGDPPLPPATTEPVVVDIGDPPLPPATTEPVSTDPGDPPLG